MQIDEWKRRTARVILFAALTAAAQSALTKWHRLFLLTSLGPLAVCVAVGAAVLLVALGLWAGGLVRFRWPMGGVVALGALQITLSGALLGPEHGWDLANMGDFPGYFVIVVVWGSLVTTLVLAWTLVTGRAVLRVRPTPEPGSEPTEERS